MGKYISIIARVLTPLAMVVFLAYEIQKSQSVDNSIWQIAIVVGAIATAVGVEAVGLLSGHNLEG